MNKNNFYHIKNIEPYLLEFLYTRDNYSIHNLNRYVNFISNIKNNTINNFLIYEKHHIIPISLGKIYEYDKNNIIKLTPREHFIAHFMLGKSFGGTQWFSCNIIAECNNPFQKRKGFCFFNTKLLQIAKENQKTESSKLQIITRNQESEHKKKERVNKWKESSRKCAVCLSILRNYSAEKTVCLTCQKKAKNDLIYGKGYSNLSKQERKLIRETYSKEKQKIKNEEILKKKLLKEETGKQKQLLKEETRKQKQLIKKEKQRKNNCECCGKDVFKKGICLDCKKHKQNLTLYGEGYEFLSRNDKFKITMNNKSEEEREISRSKISFSVSTAINNRTEEEKKYFSSLYKESSLNYYNSSSYDKEKRSNEIKNGLQKDKKNRENIL